MLRGSSSDLAQGCTGTVSKEVAVGSAGCSGSTLGRRCCRSQRRREAVGGKVDITMGSWAGPSFGVVPGLVRVPGHELVLVLVLGRVHEPEPALGRVPGLQLAPGPGPVAGPGVGRYNKGIRSVRASGSAAGAGGCAGGGTGTVCSCRRCLWCPAGKRYSLH